MSAAITPCTILLKKLHPPLAPAHPCTGTGILPTIHAGQTFAADHDAPVYRIHEETNQPNAGHELFENPLGCGGSIAFVNTH